MKKIPIIELLLGIMLISTALYTYIPQPEFMYEMTFLSNTAGGLLLIVSAIVGFAGKKELPRVLFLIETVAISVVFLISVGCTATGLAEFNFSGGMIFLHVINPLLTLIFYLLAKGEKERKPQKFLPAPAFVTAFLIFDYIRFLITGKLAYGLFPPEKLSVPVALIVGIVTAALLGGYGFGLFSAARAIRRKLEK